MGLLCISNLPLTPLPLVCIYVSICGSALVQVMAGRLVGTKPLPEPVLAYYQLDSWAPSQYKDRLIYVW